MDSYYAKDIFVALASTLEKRRTTLEKLLEEHRTKEFSGKEVISRYDFEQALKDANTGM